MRRLVLLASLAILSCSPSTPYARAPKRAPPTDADACPRFCQALSACGGVPEHCERDCRRDAALLRAGFEASFVACIEEQLEPPRCGAPAGTSVSVANARQENVRLCYFATVEAYASRDQGASMKKIVAAVCTRELRCLGKDASAETTCKGELEAHAKKGEARVLAAAREDLVQRVAQCVEARPCGDDDPFGPCFTSLEAEATP